MTLRDIADQLKNDRGFHRVTIERRRDEFAGVKVVTCILCIQATPDGNIFVLNDVATNEDGLRRCLLTAVAGYIKTEEGFVICSPSSHHCEQVRGLLASLDEA